MKKILSFLLAVLTIIGTCGGINAVAYADNTAETEKTMTRIEYIPNRKNTITEFSYGFWEKDIIGEKYYHYNYFLFTNEPGDKFIIYYSDDTQHAFTCRDYESVDPVKGKVWSIGFFDDEGNTPGYGTFHFSSTQEIEHWLVGTHYVTLEYEGLTCQIPVYIVATGWKQNNGNWYYYQNGDTLKYFQTINNKRYYFNGKGVMATGWFHGKQWYYADPRSGIVATGWRKINNKWYLFRYADSSMITGWYRNGKNKWFLLSGSGAMVTGWRKVSGIWYYFDNNGVMLCNESKRIGAKTYQFDMNGACINP